MKEKQKTGAKICIFWECVPDGSISYYFCSTWSMQTYGSANVVPIAVPESFLECVTVKFKKFVN